MFFRQYDLSCLSLYSYLIGDTTTGRAVVIDPQRDISQYLADAEAAGLRIERVIETHFHADFVSGHLEMAAATGAAISYGSRAQPDFPIVPLEDGERIELGDVVLEIRHTPGHTPESISIVAYARADEPPWGVFTGDTLFVGDVGRPDLLTSVGWSPADLARELYASLHEQLLTLPDETRVLPAHGAGSACGKHMGTAASSTIGAERRNNYALQPMPVEAFVRAVTEDQTVAPLYFAFAADANRRAHPALDEHRALPSLTADELSEQRLAGAALLDTRSADVFARSHVRGAINVGLDGRFAEYAGDVILPGQPIVVLGAGGEEAAVRLGRIGFDNVVGHVADVDALLDAQPDLGASARRYDAASLAEAIASEELQIIDVRNPSEVATGHIPGAIPVPLPTLLARLHELDRSAPTVVYCAGGYRSSVAASTLRSRGFTSVADLAGGFTAWASLAAARY